MAKSAVVLLSGGLDSATTAAVARSQGFDLYALTVAYGQRHRFELEAARRVAQSLGVRRHVVISLDLRAIGGSALTDRIEVPKDRQPAAMAGEIPVTYVPARNTVLLALALGWAEVLGAADIFIGVNAVDYSGYPDCRPEFIAAFARVAELGTKAGVEGRLKFALHELGVDFALTHSCYDPGPDGTSCGRCDACRLRLAGFAQAGLEDPLPYQQQS